MSLAAIVNSIIFSASRPNCYIMLVTSKRIYSSGHLNIRYVSRFIAICGLPNP